MKRIHIFFFGFLVLLFSSSIFLLLFRLDSYPKGLYNWENYTVWRIYQRNYGELLPPQNNYFSLTEGLMTDSGLSPFVGIPVGLIFNNTTVSLFNLRIWNVSLGVLTVLFFFFFVRNLFGLKTAAFSSLYLLFAPAFLVYMRTATNVGMSLLFSLLTFYLIYLVWEKPRKIQNYIFLIVSLVINSYLYAPIRFFLPFALLVIIWQIVSLRKYVLRHRIIQSIFIVSLCILGLFLLTNISFVTHTFVHYFHGRGEQIFTTYNETQSLHEKGATSLIPIIIKNITDLGKLYLNIDSLPAITDFWNPHGQIISTFLVPFFLFGLFITIRKIKTKQYFLLLLWFLITTIPIILTNNVHVGRLFFSLPPLFIFVGIGLSQLVHYTDSFSYTKLRYVILGSLMIISLFFEVSPYFSKQLPIPNYISTNSFKKGEMSNSDVYLFNVDYESLRFWTAYFYLHNDYAFVDLLDPKRTLNENKKSHFVIYFIEQGATKEDIQKYCNKKAYPVLLAGSADPSFLTIQCKKRIIQI